MTQTQSPDELDIKVRLQRFEAAFDAGDADAVAALFEDEGIILPPNESERVGKQAVWEWHRNIFDQFQGSAELRAVEVEVSGNLAYLRGAYDMKLTDSDGIEIEDRGKLIMIWKQESGGPWKVWRNIWNSSEPLAEV